MNRSIRRRKGAALLVALIMLGLISLIVLSTFTLSSSNVKAVSNMQFRVEADHAARAAIEQVLASPFTTAPTAEEIDIDLNHDDVVDYTVSIAQPTCISAKGIPPTSSDPSSLSLGEAFRVGTAAYYLTVWDIDATVKSSVGGAAASGTAMHMHEGVRVTLNETQVNAVCS